MTTPNAADNLQAGAPAQGGRKNNFLAATALTLGITGLVALIFIRPLAFVPAIAAVVLGLVALKEPQRRWMAVAGIVLGILVLLGMVGVWKILL
ncbi:DUF4190 domain-containing protein [Desulfurivibrio alkaliphilus]|uniref:DUF4190 domain-containing protein n=1 Tax=Desulfurivibrio alkaliphilus (strain DSM 19089 / UNIQEM U267 / AHT2) TaxID=589865 RepID=D6Z0Q2_DESAT|nr:DUF4190 domain-containing protein [Desulfurivibrio alkaliphilus]ADH85281.1 conserved hypothetical protein [Desulfurivibrio alkaliphilus AHT 2]